MANRMCIAVVFAALFLVGAESAQDCTTSATQLTSCLAYITGPDFTPPSACCQAVMSVNMRNPTCMCTVFAQLDQSNPAVNVTKAYALPNDCNVMVNTASCSTFSTTPSPGSAVPPGIALPSSPLTTPPGLSPIILSPTSFADSPLMPPMSASPPVSPAAPPTEMSPVGVPVADSPVSYAPVEGPVSVSADGPAIAEGPGANDGTVPIAASSGASVVGVSMILCATLAGVLALLL